MKEAQECKSGSIVKLNNQLMVVQKATYYKGGRGSATITFKFRNIESGNLTEAVYKASDKLDDVSLERRKMEYSYKDGDMFVFMDKVSFEQTEVTADLLGEYVPYLKEQMEVDMYFYDGRAVSLDFPTFVTMEITYTENVAKGDTSGKVMKKAKLDSGYEVDVPSFCNIGDKIKIDTRSHEYVERVK